MNRHRDRAGRPSGLSMTRPLMPTFRQHQLPTSRCPGVRNNDVDTVSLSTGSSTVSNQQTGSRLQQLKRRRSRSSSSPRLRPYGDGTLGGGSSQLSAASPASSSPSTINRGRGHSSSLSRSFSGSDDDEMPFLRAFVGGCRGDDEAAVRRRRSPPPLIQQAPDMGPDFWKTLVKWSSRGAGDRRRDGGVEFNDDEDDRRTASTSGSGDGDAMTGEDRQRWFEYFISMYKYNKERAEAKRRRHDGSNSPPSPPLRLSPEMVAITRESKSMGLLPTPNTASPPSLMNLELSVPRGWISSRETKSSSRPHHRYRDDDDADPEPRRRKRKRMSRGDRGESRERSPARDCSPESRKSPLEKRK